MIRATVEVGNESGAFSVTVCAENLRRAVELAADKYPGRSVRLRFPLDPEVFFVEVSPVGTKTLELLAKRS